MLFLQQQYRESIVRSHLCQQICYQTSYIFFSMFYLQFIKVAANHTVVIFINKGGLLLYCTISLLFMRVFLYKKQLFIKQLTINYIHKTVVQTFMSCLLELKTPVITMATQLLCECSEPHTTYFGWRTSGLFQFYSCHLLTTCTILNLMSAAQLHGHVHIIKAQGLSIYPTIIILNQVISSDDWKPACLCLQLVIH